MVYALATGRLWFRVPETIRYEFTGDLQPAVSWKDVILHLAGRFGSDGAQYRSMGVRRTRAARNRHVEQTHGRQHGA